MVPVAPVMADPSRFHWYAYETPAGAHPATAAVRVEPTVAVPVIVTVPAVTCGLTTAAVGREVLV